MSSPKPFERKLAAGFVAVSLVMLMAAAVVWHNSIQLEKAGASIAHTHQTIAKLEETAGLIKDAVAATRGYVITGDESWLEPYRAAAEQVDAQIAWLDELAAPDPEQKQRLTEFTRSSGLIMARRAEVIRLANEAGLAAAQTSIKEGGGNRELNVIHRLVAEMRAHEKAALEEQRRASEAANLRAQLTVIALAGLVCAILLGCYWLTRHHMRMRRQMEDERDQFFTLSLDLFCIAGTDGYFKTVNPAFTKALGWSAEELLGRPFAEFVHPEDRDHTQREVQNLADGRPTTDFENRYRCKDGSWRWLSWRSVPQPSGLIFAAARDVTEARTMQEALRVSQESLAATLDSIGDAVLATDVSGKITRLNPVAERLTGWPAADALGRHVSEVFKIINEDTREPAAIPVDEVLATGRIQGLANHTVLIARDGTECPIADSAAPIRDTHGQLAGVVLVFRDVSEERKAAQTMRRLNESLNQRVRERTSELENANQQLLQEIAERKEAQESVARNEALLRSITEHVDEIIFVKDRERRMVFMNGAGLRANGRPLEEFLGKKDEEWHPNPQEVAAYAAADCRVMELRRAETVEEEFTSATGEKRIFLTTKTPRFDAAGQVIGLVGITRDISHQKQAERETLRAQRLEAIGTLAGGVAHDLNNALAPILMSAELLRMSHPNSGSEMLEWIEIIETNAQRGALMVRQLLTFARGAEGERVSIQARHLLREVERIIRGTFPKNIRLVSHLSGDFLVVVGDPTQLHQVLLNLCVNARDAMPDGGVLTLEAEAVTIDSNPLSPPQKPGRYVAFRVRDTGTGIPPEVMDRIFEPFFTTKGPDRGTGLGLSTVMGIAKGHAGFVRAESVPGRGSTLSVFIPAAHPEAEVKPSGTTASAFRGNRETILIVDDEPAMREVLRMVLDKFNFKPVMAVDGVDALIRLSELREDLQAIITDLHMPHMDGVALVRALRRMLPNLPVIISSGRLEERQAQELKTLGIAATLEKPFRHDQIIETLKRIFPPA